MLNSNVMKESKKTKPNQKITLCRLGSHILETEREQLNKINLKVIISQVCSMLNLY